MAQRSEDPTESAGDFDEEPTAAGGPSAAFHILASERASNGEFLPCPKV